MIYFSVLSKKCFYLQHWDIWINLMCVAAYTLNSYAVFYFFCVMFFIKQGLTSSWGEFIDAYSANGRDPIKSKLNVMLIHNKCSEKQWVSIHFLWMISTFWDIWITSSSSCSNCYWTRKIFLDLILIRNRPYFGKSSIFYINCEKSFLFSEK